MVVVSSKPLFMETCIVRVSLCLLQKYRIDPWIYTFLEELVLFELKRSAVHTPEQTMPGVLRHTLSCLQFLTQHISDSAELFRVYGVLLLKANKPAESVFNWLKEYRCLQVPAQSLGPKPFFSEAESYSHACMLQPETAVCQPLKLGFRV